MDEQGLPPSRRSEMQSVTHDPPPTARLLTHTFLVGTLASSFILAPYLLIFRRIPNVLDASLSTFIDNFSVFLLALGCGACVGAVLTRCIDRSACGKTAWRVIMLASWLLNPVVVVFFVQDLKYCSAMPLAFVVLVATCQVQFCDADPDWSQNGCCSVPLLMAWFFNRVACIGIPMCVVSFQVMLYLPQANRPRGAEVGLFVCADCVLISIKFCMMCAQLGHRQLTQGIILLVWLSADWISSLSLLNLIDQNKKTILLLIHLAIVGMVQWHVAMKRMRLWSRWCRTMRYLRNRRIAVNDGDQELEVGLGSVRPTLESDSDEDGPNGFSGGFYQGILVIWGITPQHARRQFLCPTRRARVMGTVPSESNEQENAVAPADASQQGPTTQNAGAPDEAASLTIVPLEITPGLEIVPSLQLCTICQEDIRTNDEVRPLPRCVHVFHSACLEGWAKTQGESTQCPTCRRPALAKKAVEGTLSIASLMAREQETSSVEPPAPGRERGDRRGNGPGGSGSGHGDRAPPGRPRRPPPGAGGRPQSILRTRPQQSRTNAVALLRLTLSVSEPMAQAAVDLANGAPDTAANVLLEHRTVIEAAYGGEHPTNARMVPPPGLVEALIEGNPHLAGAEALLRAQLAQLLLRGRLGMTPWTSLSQSAKVNALRVVLNDVAGRLEEAAG